LMPPVSVTSHALKPEVALARSRAGAPKLAVVPTITLPLATTTAADSIAADVSQPQRRGLPAWSRSLTIIASSSLWSLVFQPDAPSPGCPGCLEAAELAMPIGGAASSVTPITPRQIGSTPGDSDARRY